MPRTGAKVTQADIARVLRAVKQAGMQMKVEISANGNIVLEPFNDEGLAENRGQTHYAGEIKLW